jgi:hypothetical protein
MGHQNSFRLFALIGAFACFAFAQIKEPPLPDPIDTTISEILARSESFSGKRVRIRARFESDGLERSVLVEPQCAILHDTKRRPPIDPQCKLGIAPYDADGVEDHPDIKAFDRALDRGGQGTLDKRIVATFTGRFICRPTCSAIGGRILEIDTVSDLDASEIHDPPEIEAQYYPLAAGNSWTYTIIAPSLKKPKKVIWHVDRVLTDEKTNEIYVVAPTPMETDDQTMNLTVDASGVFDRVGEFYLFKFPLNQGDRWGTPGIEEHFLVKDVHVPCAVGRFKFDDCLVIENRDTHIHMRTLTTYAKGVGPIKYEYTNYSEEDPKKSESRVSLVTLLSYRISR